MEIHELLIPLFEELEIDVEENAIGACLVEGRRQFGVVPPRPGPLSDVAQGSIVDRNEDDLAACLMYVSFVAACPKQVLGKLAGAD